MIIRGGANVYPEIIESVLRAHPNVADAAAVGGSGIDRKAIAQIHIREERVMTAAIQLYFEDFLPGRVFEGQTRTLGEEEFRMFAAITGDAHPIHYDPEYAARSRFGKRVAHGLLVMAISALGATALSERLSESMVAFVEQDCKFLKPVLIGDVVHTQLEVETVKPKSGGLGLVRFIVRVIHKNGDVALLGHHSYLLKCRIGEER